MQYVIFALAVIAVIVVVKLLSWPFRKIFKLLLNIFFGVCLIVLVNTFGVGIGIAIPFNWITALIAGILGVPGVICLIIINYIF